MRIQLIDDDQGVQRRHLPVVADIGIKGLRVVASASFRVDAIQKINHDQRIQWSHLLVRVDVGGLIKVMTIP